MKRLASLSAVLGALLTASPALAEGLHQTLQPHHSLTWEKPCLLEHVRVDGRQGKFNQSRLLMIYHTSDYRGVVTFNGVTFHNGTQFPVEVNAYC